MNKRPTIFWSLIICSLLAGTGKTVASTPGTTGAQILEMVPDAKTAAMGDTYCGLNGEISCLYYNPAGLAAAKNVQLTSSSEQWQGMNHTYLGMAYNLHDIRTSNVMDMGTLAVAFSDLNSGEISGMDANENATGSFSARDQLLICSYAKNVYEQECVGEIAAGVNIKFVTEEISDNNAKAMAFDAGVLWKLPLYNACIGLTRQNIGSNIRYEEEEFALPTNTKLSLSAKAFYEALTMNLDLNKPDASSIIYNFGVEYIFENTMYLRLGYNNKYADICGLTTGIGVCFKQVDVFFLYASEVSIDYAFIPDSELGNMNKISISMKLGAD